MSERAEAQNALRAKMAKKFDLWDRKDAKDHKRNHKFLNERKDALRHGNDEIAKILALEELEAFDMGLPWDTKASNFSSDLKGSKMVHGHKESTTGGRYKLKGTFSA